MQTKCLWCCCLNYELFWYFLFALYHFSPRLHWVGLVWLKISVVKESLTFFSQQDVTFSWPNYSTWMLGTDVKGRWQLKLLCSHAQHNPISGVWLSATSWGYSYRGKMTGCKGNCMAMWVFHFNNTILIFHRQCLDVILLFQV